MCSTANTSFIFSLFLLIIQNVFGDTLEEMEQELQYKLGYTVDSLSNFTEMATRYGYVSEQHTVVTEDGYVSTMFRITKGRKCKRPIKNPPVLLVHGLLMSSDSFLDSGPNAGLGYLISDLCYDLWAPNVRGNHYAKGHIKLDSTVDKAFWDFENFEFGYYDIPAFVDYVLSYTKSEKLNYIGFSQGGSSFLIMTSERPEYTNKIGVAIFLEPASRQINTRSQLFRFFSEGFQINYPLLSDIGYYEVLPQGGLVQKLFAFICQDTTIANSICRLALSLIDAPHPGSLATNTIKVLSGHFPAGTSVKNMAWYGQSINIDVFQKFDYGVDKNLQMYGSVQPPAYNLSSVDVPIVIIHGRNDQLAAPADVEWLASKLPNLLEEFYVKERLWNHFDVTYSRFTSKYILPKIRDYLKKYSN